MGSRARKGAVRGTAGSSGPNTGQTCPGSGAQVGTTWLFNPPRGSAGEGVAVGTGARAPPSTVCMRASPGPQRGTSRGSVPLTEPTWPFIICLKTPEGWTAARHTHVPVLPAVLRFKRKPSARGESLVPERPEGDDGGHGHPHAHVWWAHAGRALCAAPCQARVWVDLLPSGGRQSPHLEALSPSACSPTSQVWRPSTSSEKPAHGSRPPS